MDSGILGNLAAAQATGQDLVPAADVAANENVRVREIRGHTDTQCTFTIEDTDGNQLYPTIPLPANGDFEFVAGVNYQLITVPAGLGVQFDTSAAITGGLHVVYDIEG